MNKPSVYITKVLVNTFSLEFICIYLHVRVCHESVVCAHVCVRVHALGVLLCHSLPLRRGLSLNLAFSHLGWKPVSPSDPSLCLPRRWGYRHTLDSCLATRMLLESDCLIAEELLILILAHLPRAHFVGSNSVSLNCKMNINICIVHLMIIVLGDCINSLHAYFPKHKLYIF